MTEPVFVDRTGRRRRMATVLGAALAVLLTGTLALLVSALLGGSPMPLPGLPSNGEQRPPQPDGSTSVVRQGAVTSRATPNRTPAAGQSTATPSGAAPTATATVTTTPPRGNRPSHPRHPKPSRSK